jgi:type IV secretion system protein VirD4
MNSTIQHFFYSSSLFFSELGSSFGHGKHLHNARFARPHELKALEAYPIGEKAVSLLLGESHYSRFLRVQPTRNRRELGNLLVVAPTRGGKGLLAVSQLLTWPHSVVVNDIKGDLYQQTAGYRQTFSDVYVIDPEAKGNQHNPLQGKQTEDELFSSATHLLFKADEGDGAIFTQRATVMLTQVLLAAKIKGFSPLPFVRYIVRLGLEDAAIALNTISPELATQFLDNRIERVNFETDRFLTSSWGTLAARMRPLLTENVIRCFDGSDFTAEEIMTAKRPVTIYLRWPERDLLALSPLVRLLWGSIIDDLITMYDKTAGKNCNPVLLLLDEAGRTAIPSLAEHATTVVGRGISLWIAIQSLSQLEAVYGKARAQILRDNMETQLYYRPSNQQTAEYLERCLGKRSSYAHSHTKHEGTETSEGLSEQGIPLLTAQDIKRLRDEDIIGFHRNLQPFRAKRMDWRRFPILAQRRDMPPPDLAILPPLEERPVIGGLSSAWIDPDGMN